MADSPVVREIAWREVFPWLSLVHVFRLSIQARMLLLGAAGIVATTAGWMAFAALFAGSDDAYLQAWTEQYAWSNVAQQNPLADAAAPRGADSPALPPTPVPMDIAPDDAPFGVPPVGRAMGAFKTLQPWHVLSDPFRRLFDPNLTWVGLAFVLLCALWADAVWALVGGAITRTAAVQLAREESIGLLAALGYARRKWLSYFAAPLFPLLGVLLFTVPMALFGVLLRGGEVGGFIVGVVWPLYLIAGLLMTIFLFGLAVGWPLMLPTISAEGTDAFDALSRTYSYVYQRPLHYLLLALFATLLGGLGWILVYIFGEWTIYLPKWAASWGGGSAVAVGGAEFAESTLAGAWWISFWSGLVALVVMGYGFSYFFTASTAIYFRLRYDVDGAEDDQVYLDPQDQTFGMPALENDEAGVPRVAEHDTPEAPPPEGANPTS